MHVHPENNKKSKKESSGKESEKRKVQKKAGKQIRMKRKTNMPSGRRTRTWGDAADAEWQNTGQHSQQKYRDCNRVSRGRGGRLN